MATELCSACRGSRLPLDPTPPHAQYTHGLTQLQYQRVPWLTTATVGDSSAKPSIRSERGTSAVLVDTPGEAGSLINSSLACAPRNGGCAWATQPQAARRARGRMFRARCVRAHCAAQPQAFTPQRVLRCTIPPVHTNAWRLIRPGCGVQGAVAWGGGFGCACGGLPPGGNSSSKTFL